MPPTVTVGEEPASALPGEGEDVVHTARTSLAIPSAWLVCSFQVRCDGCPGGGTAGQRSGARGVAEVRTLVEHAPVVDPLRQNGACPGSSFCSCSSSRAASARK